MCADAFHFVVHRRRRRRRCGVQADLFVVDAVMSGIFTAFVYFNNKKNHIFYVFLALINLFGLIVAQQCRRTTLCIAAHKA